MSGIKLGVRPSGRIGVLKRKRSGLVTEQRLFNNLVLDVGWNHLMDRLVEGGSGKFPGYLYLGTGTTEPSRSDTGLQNISGTLPAKAYATTSLAPSSQSNRYAGIRLTFNYGEGEAEGLWTELGLAFDNQYSRPYNRALFRDENDDPITLQVLSDEFLTVFVELGMQFPTEPITGTFLYNGTQHTFSFDFVPSSSSTFFVGNDRNFWHAGFHVSMGYFGTNTVSSSPETGLYLIEGALKAAGTRIGSVEVDPHGTSDRIYQGAEWGRFGAFAMVASMRINFDPPVVIPADHKALIEPTFHEIHRAD